MNFIPKNILNELVNSDGTRIGGNNVKLSRDDSKSASNSTNDPMYDKDGNQIKNSVIQSTRQQGYRGFYSLVPMPAVKTPTASIYNYMDNIDYMENKKIPKKGEKYSDVTVKTGGIETKSVKRTVTVVSVYPKEKEALVRTNAGGDAIVKFDQLKDKIEETNNRKMKVIIEDILDNKISKDINIGGINKNGIPDIDIISDENPLLVRKVTNLIDIIEKNQATGEQKGVILNFLINNIGVVNIPMEYKQEMLKKLK